MVVDVLWQIKIFTNQSIRIKEFLLKTKIFFAEFFGNFPKSDHDYLECNLEMNV